MASGDAPRLTTQQGTVVSDDQNTLRAGERGPGVLVAPLAVWKAGGVYLPLDPAYPEERLAYLLGDAQAGAQEGIKKAFEMDGAIEAAQHATER